MSRIKSLIKNLNLREKLIFYCYAVITPILLLISLLLVIRNYETTQTDSQLMQAQSAQSLEDSLDVLRSDMQNICTYLCVNEDIGKILNSSEPELLNQNFQLWLDEAPMNIVLDILALKGYIKTIAIYPENGVNPYLRCLDATAYVNETDIIQKSEAYKMAVEAAGAVKWGFVPKEAADIYQSNRNDKIVLYREMYDLSKKKKLGFLVLGANADGFYELCENTVQNENEGILILTPQGEQLFTYGNCDAEVVRALISDSSWKGKRSEGMAQCGTFDIFWAQNDKNSLTVCKIVPRTSAGALLKQSLTTPVILLTVLLLGLCPVFLFLARVVTKPLKRLTEAMGKFQKGDFTQQIPVESNDELGVVADCFNDMVEDIKKLIDTNYVMALHEKESELNALQAQINPHFLYNTLDALYWRAMDSENEEIAEDILSLSNLFRMLLGQGKGMIPVENEENLIETYLHIQKMRFSKRFDYTIHIEDEIKNVLIPKLILQPFVENAVVHGFENTDAKCTLAVLGHSIQKEKNAYIEFTISDTGRGMTKEQLADIWNIEESRRYASQRIGHYAINNVKERLELKYHEKYELTITSEEGKGTSVVVIIPIEERGEN